MQKLERFIDRLPPIFAGLGLVGLVVAVGLYLASGGLERYAIPVVAASLALLVYYVIERPSEVLRFFTGRATRYGGNALAMSLAFVLIVGLLNVLANRFSYRYDMTESKDYTLSPQTVKILGELKQPITLTHFYSDQAGGKQAVQDTLGQFTRYTDKLNIEYVDVQARPGLARQYNVDFPGTTVVESNGRKQTTTGTTEGDLISVILKVTRGDPLKVYAVIGQGEPDPSSSDQTGFSSLKQALEAENYQVESLNLVTTPKVPDDAAAIVLAGPTTALQAPQLQALFDYIDKGGKALVLASPNRTASLTELASRYGIELGQGFIIDVGQSLPNEPLVPVVAGQGYLFSPITRSMPSMTVFPLATMVRPKQGGDPSGKITAQAIAQSSSNSWFETDVNNRQPTFDPAKDIRGPIPIASTVTLNDTSQLAPGSNQTSQNPPPKAGRLVFVGNVDFATNSALNVEGNRDFLLNSVNWLTEEEDLISVRAKAPADRRLTLTGGQSNLVLYGSVIVLPLAVLGFGAWFVWGRR